MGVRSGTAVRLLGLSLLVLALSPVTAPFSSVDLAQLFGGSAAQPGAILQSKAGGDEKVAEVAATFAPAAALVAFPTAVAWSGRHDPPRALRSIPLRI